MTGATDPARVPDRVVTLVESTPPFDLLSPALRQQLVRDLLVEYFEPDERILVQGAAAPEHLYLVESGSVRLVDVRRGCLVDVCGEGDTFGAADLLAGGEQLYEAVASEPTVCALLPADGFRALCAAAPAFADFFAENLKPEARAAAAAPDRADAQFLVGARVGALVRHKPLTCPSETTVREAARKMRAERANSILVVRGSRAAGILTDADLRDKVVAEGASPEAPVEGLMSAPVVSVGADTLVFDALMQMSRRRIHHLVVTADAAPDSRVLGILSDQDISHAKGMNPVATVRRIEKARSITELARIRTEADRHLLRLYQHGIRPEDLTEVVAEINDRLTLRLLHLAEAELRADAPHEAVDLRWTWLALGSKGRREMGLRGDQDNALLYEDPSGPAEREQADRWFGIIAGRVVMGLAACGFTLCKGGVMATNPKWRQPLSQWKRIFRDWVLEPEPRALMHASIFFDLRPMHRDTELGRELTDDLCDALQHERGFLTFLTHNATANRPPLSFFRRFVVDRSGEYRHTFDLKLHGLMPVVDLARVLALEARFIESTNTFDRLEHAGRRLAGAAEVSASAADAFRYLLDMRFAHHLQLLEAGGKPDDHIDPEALSKTQQQMLRAVFSTVQDAQDNLVHRHGAHLIRR